MIYGGLYHLFWQWNPSIVEPASAGGFVNMHWGHAISHDLLGWKQLPIALQPDGASCGGEWSGSATVDAPGGVTLSYSVQCNSYFGQATPVNAAHDPLLVNWTANHVVGHKAPGTGGFRDPSTAFKAADGKWRQLLACNGAACVYESSDFEAWQYIGHAAGTGKGATFEMPDFFALPTGSPSAGSHFLKVGMENGTDYWSTGTFDAQTNLFIPHPGAAGFGSANSTAWDNRLDTQRCDYGSFYSSKTFATPEAEALSSSSSSSSSSPSPSDPSSSPRALIGWVGEEAGSPLLQWAGIQSLPRLVTADPDHPGRALFTPVPSLASLRENRSTVAAINPLKPATWLRLPQAASGVQLDVSANFSGPFSAGQSFGIGVLAEQQQEGQPSQEPGHDTMTTATVSIADGEGGPGGWATITVGPHTGRFLLPKSLDQPLDLRVIVDHSVVEAFVSGGRAVITRRVYKGPSATGAYVFNDGTAGVGLAGLEAFQMRAPTRPTIEELRRKAASAVVATATA